MLQRMNRIEIETVLNKDRAWLLETVSAILPDDLYRGVTQSEHDPKVMWSMADHFVHTSLIEHNWNAMVRKHFAGAPDAVGMRTNADGTPKSREEVMAGIHAWTEEWADKHRGKSLDELVAVGQNARGETLTLLAELTDEQLQSKIPGAPWADGTVGAILAANAAHGRMHFKYAKDGLEAAK